jgi:hypothetical protein
LNKNNNNSSSTESLTAVTSVYTIQLSPPKTHHSRIIPRRCERRLSSPAMIYPLTINKLDENDVSFKNIDTCV